MISKWMRRIIERPRTTIAISVAFTVLIGAAMAQLQIDPSAESMILETDRSRQELQHFSNVFGEDDNIILAFAVPEVFEKKFLDFTRRLTGKLESLEVVSSVDSLANAGRIVGVEKGAHGGLEVSDFLKPFPESGEDIQLRREEALSTPMYDGMYLGKDARVSALIIRLANRAELVQNDDAFAEDLDEELLAHLAAKRARYGEENFRGSIIADIGNAVKESGEKPGIMAGFFVTEMSIIDSIKKDNLIFVPLTMTVLCLLLLAAFRSMLGVWLPMAVMVMSLMVTIGAMALAQVKVTIANSFLPVVIMIIAIADVIHILVKYYEDIDKFEKKEDALHHAVVHIFKPCFYTSVTTFVGFLSLLMSDVVPIREFGVFAGIGVLAAFAFSITFAVAVLALASKPSAANLAVIQGRWMDGLLHRVTGLNERFRSPIAIGTVILCIMCVASIAFLNVETSFDKFFKKSSETARHIQFVDDNLAGAGSLDILVEVLDDNGVNYSDVKNDEQRGRIYQSVMNGVKDREVLLEIERLQAYLADHPVVRKTISIVDVLKEINKSIYAKAGRESMANYKLPATQNEILSDLFLFTSSASHNELRGLVDRAYTKARISLRMKAVGTSEMVQLLADIDSFVAANISSKLKVTTVGKGVLFAKMTENFVSNQMIGFSTALVFIVVTIGLIFSSWRMAMLAIIPNVFPILLGFLAMAVFSIDLNINTVAVASIAIGLVVDDTIHFLSRFREEYLAERDHRLACERTILSVGRALGFTSFILSGGFLLLAFSDFVPTIQLGILLALVIMAALLADLVVTPVVIRLTQPQIRATQENKSAARAAANPPIAEQPSIASA